LKRQLLLGAAFAALASNGARAAAEAPQCRLARYSSLPITTLSDGRFAIPVTVQDHAMSFMVDTGGVSATITSEQAKALGLTVKGTFRYLMGVAGSLLTSYVSADSFSIGRLTGTGLPVYIDPRITGIGVDGTLAPDMMSKFDVDIDFGHSIFNLFSPDHCPGKVVYWTQGDHVEIPMDFAPNGHIRVPVTVNGKPLTAMLDTGSRTSVMSLSTARDVLGISENDPKLKLKESFGTKSRYREYTYPFETLDLNGIAVKSPHITIFSDDTVKGVSEQLILGVGILRQLHLYIAYREHKLYVTPALAN
jgi:predicted aspartyl protease